MKQAMLKLVGALLAVLWVGAVFSDDSRFVLSDMTVKDKHTGLIWMRNANIGKQDKDGATELLKRLNREKYAGYEDWRLPTVEELESLVQYAADVGYSSYPKGPYNFFNQMGFYNVQAGGYWSSSTWIFMAFGGGGWGVSMDNGKTDDNNRANRLHVWPVREGI
ncbi:MAG: DUF1566 domain-containing protein [Sulfuritalea sp.]|jgi:hypothetical protein|nr:DUF1566 domain-containing protein [Sulfuritalea sp.]